MDRKSIIILVVCFILLMMWVPLSNRIWPPIPAPPRATNQVAAGTNRTAPGTNVITAAPPATNVPPAQAESTPPFPPEAKEETITLENKDARYIFTSHGGGLKLIELKTYPKAVTCNKAVNTAPTNRVTLNTAAPLPVMALVDGAAVQGDGVYQLSKTATGVRAEKQLPNGLSLVKEFQLGTNYLVQVKTRLENRSGQPVSVPARQWVLGTATALDAQDDPTKLGVYWYNGDKKQSVDQGWFANKTLGCFPGTPRTEYQQGSNNVAWGALHSQFFTLAVIPNEPASQIRVVETNLTATATNVGQAAPAGAKPNPQTLGFQASFVYPATNLAPNQAIERQFNIYAGPKEYKILVRLGNQFKNNLETIMDFEGFFGWFAQLLLSSMNGLNSLGLSYGLAIIAITVIIKLLFWPLTIASTRSMKRMAALQPQMKAIQEKFKDDPAKMNRKMMEFMKEHKVSPLGGCLPMLLQIPVFFGFYRMILSAIELRGARFLWACDLSKPDTLFLIPALNIPFNPLPLVMGVTMLWQARLTPPSPGMDPLQQRMMRYMPLMFLFILYNFSAGLTLYWTVQNLLTIAQMKLTKTKDEPAAPGARAPAPPPGPRKRK